MVVGLVILFFWKGCHPAKFPDSAIDHLTSYSESQEEGLIPSLKPCDGREYCVYIYLAPWCPHCKERISFIHNYRKIWAEKDRPGLMVIVGNDKLSALQNMAKQIGAPVFLDPKEGFRKEFHISAFPYYMVVDAKKNIVASDDVGMRWVEDEINGRWKK